MSTAYYELREPITHIELQGEDTEYVRVHIGIEGDPCGYITLNYEHLAGFLRLLFDTNADDRRCVAVVNSNGLRINRRHLDPGMMLLSEYDELTTLGDLQAAAGRD